MKKLLTADVHENAASETIDAIPADCQVPFTTEHMLTLLKAYEAYDRLKVLVKDIAGNTADFSFGNSIMGDLTYIEKLIADLSPVYNPQEDYEDSRFYHLLSDSDIPARVKAAELLLNRRQI